MPLNMVSKGLDMYCFRISATFNGMAIIAKISQLKKDMMLKKVPTIISKVNAMVNVESDAREYAINPHNAIAISIQVK
tara:strand:+ start:2370 stop:2603 length:234 start_codon:yes stop_codon:yes gene_type:complete